jgi:hypothetical protein
MPESDLGHKLARESAPSPLPGMSDENEEPRTQADIELDELMDRASASMLRTLDEHVDVEAELRAIHATLEADPDRITRDPR